MDNHHNFLEDDDNDTALFERLQQQVLDNCPNPERLGCPSPSVLSAFVDSPASATPAELNDLHILKCAECTRDLIDLSRKRESGRALESKSSLGRPRLAVLAAMVVAVLCGILATTTVYWKSDYLSESKNAILNAVTVAKTIDLGRYGATRGMEPEQQDRTISLPRATIDLDLILPYFSQPGQYRVTVANERGAASPVVSVSGVAETVTTRTELKITLNLRDLPSGMRCGERSLSRGLAAFFFISSTGTHVKRSQSLPACRSPRSTTNSKSPVPKSSYILRNRASFES